jgi:hypothetical protein
MDSALAGAVLGAATARDECPVNPAIASVPKATTTRFIQ